MPVCWNTSCLFVSDAGLRPVAAHLTSNDFGFASFSSSCPFPFQFWSFFSQLKIRHPSLSLLWDARASLVPARGELVGWKTIGRGTPAVQNQMQYSLPSDDVRNPITRLGPPLNALLMKPLVPSVLRAGCWLRKASQRLVAAAIIN